jgi:hypothetical protein
VNAGAGADRTRRTMKAWAVTFGLFFVLLLLFFAGFGVLGALGWLSLRSALALAAVFMVGLVAVMVVAWRILGEAHHPRVYREARDRGLPASATVLDLDQTGWRTGGGLDLRLRTRRKRYEYALRLRVAHPAAGEFEAETTAYLAGDEIPEVGDGVRVRVHPERPDVVVIDLPR